MLKYWATSFEEKENDVLFRFPYRDLIHDIVHICAKSMTCLARTFKPIKILEVLTTSSKRSNSQ